VFTAVTNHLNGSCCPPGRDDMSRTPLGTASTLSPPPTAIRPGGQSAPPPKLVFAAISNSFSAYETLASASAQPNLRPLRTDRPLRSLRADLIPTDGRLSLATG
jgi:hypothetical protein